MHIYAFGSICRGDVSADSDVDLLAIVDGFDSRFDPNVYSVYSYQRINEIWAEGNPFAWHLAIESRLLFSSDGLDLLRLKGKPSRYRACRQDCEKFQTLFLDARSSMMDDTVTRTFDLSMVFLAIRNFATCFSLGCSNIPDFSRHSAIRIGERSLSIPLEAYRILERARILCTRGHGPAINDEEAQMAARHFPGIEEWMNTLLLEVSCRGT